jgi:two-component system, cell cycle sensor histidine kinase and response regulator CckA
MAGRTLSGSRPDSILIIEDDALTRTALTQILISRGATVLAVASGEEGLEQLAGVDLVLLDAMLPGRDGWSICRDIKARDSRLTVIMVTARAEPEAVLRTFEAGADDYVAKPFRTVELIARIESRLRARRSEEAGAAAEARLRHLLAHTPVVIRTCQLTPPYAPTFVSDNVAAVLGHPSSAFLEAADFWLRHIHPDDRMQVDEQLGRLGGGGPAVLEYRFLHGSGEYRWMRDEVTVLKRAGQGRELVGSWTDVTDRRVALQQLRRNAEQMRATASAAVAVNAALSVEHALQVVTEQAREIMGAHHAASYYSADGGWDTALRAAARSPQWEEVSPATTDSIGQELFRQAWRAGGVVRWAADFPPPQRDPGEANADRLGIECLAAPLTCLEGQCVGVICVCARTEGRFSESDELALLQLARIVSVAVDNARLYGKVVEAERRYHHFFEDDLTGDFISSPEGRILECNTAFARMFGFSSVEEVLRSDVTRLYRSAEQREEFIARLSEHGKLELHEMELRGVDGRPVHIIENAIGSFDEAGNLTGIKGYMFDVTERKTLEQQFLQAQKMEVVGVLAGGIAHDFNNLLTVIRGNTQLLLAEIPETDERRECVQEIDSASARAVELTHQLLAFSRRQMLLPRLVDLNATIIEMGTRLRSTIGADIELVTALEPELDTVTVDPGQIQQVIMNLVVNARDAMPDGGILTVETANVYLSEEEARQLGNLADGRYVLLRVGDTGTGMSAEVRAHVFEPFFTTKEVGKGTGLGLSTVYGVVRQSDGFLVLESDLGRGTSFRVYLPSAEFLAGRLQNSSASEVNVGQETILLVEDEQAVRYLARRVLERSGYHVLEAASGKEALEIENDFAGEIHLLLTDMQMSGLGGGRLAEELTKRRNALRVLFMSGHLDEALIRNHGGSREIAFLQKPFTPQDLAAHVREVLDSPAAAS